MTVLALISPGGSPGVTTAALGLALAWPRDVVVAECDPAGGSALAGMWRGQAAGNDGGLLRFALAAQRDAQAAGEAIRTHAMPLEDGLATRFVLPAPPGPLAARQLAAAWPAIATAFTAATADVIADLGRFDADPALAPVLAGAGSVLMVCRPLIRQAVAAKPRLEALAAIRPSDPPADLVLAGTGPYGPDGPKVFREALEVPVRASLPWDPATAAVLSDGALPRRGFGRSPLMRATAALVTCLARQPEPQPVDGAPVEVMGR
jgi:hypothetical protein